MRERIRSKFGSNCHYCGGPDAQTLDHKIPLTRGGTWDLENTVLACQKCNRAKGIVPYETAKLISVERPFRCILIELNTFLIQHEKQVQQAYHEKATDLSCQ